MSYLTSRQRADLDAYLTRDPYDGPEVTMFPERHIKATRAKHECYACRKTIPVGFRAIRMTGTEDGKFFSSYCHFHCDAHNGDCDAQD
jgi:hypothetical protein